MRTAKGTIFEATCDPDQGICFVRLAQTEYSSLDAEKLAQLSRLLRYLVERSVAHKLVIDLSNVQFFGAGFVGVLIDTWNLLDEAGRRLVLRGLTPYCGRLIRNLHLDKLFEIHPAQGTAPEREYQHVASEEQRDRVAPDPIRITDVEWSPDLVREEYLGDDGVPVRSVIRPRQRPTKT